MKPAIVCSKSSGKKRVRFARIQRHLIVALCGLALASLFPHRISAQQIDYNDFNIPQANPGQTSTSCSANPAASGILFCFNNMGSGLTFIQDNSYTSTIDPNASNGTAYALQLTQQLVQSQSSSVWYSIPQNVAGGFTAWYAFKITPDPAPYGDGLAFVIQNAIGGGTDAITKSTETGSGLTVFGVGGGGLGYAGIDNSIALEADTFPDDWDPWDFGEGIFIDNHVALQSCGSGAANSPAHYVSNADNPLVATNCLVSLGGTFAIASNPNSSGGTGGVNVADGLPHQVVIVYNGPNDSPMNTIYVYLDPAFNPGTHTPMAGSTPIFSGTFDIKNYINLNNGTANIGFTAATGGSTQQNELMGFTFTPHDSGSANVCPPAATTPAPCSTTIPVTFSFAEDTTIGSIQVVTQGVPDLDFTQANGGNCSGNPTAGSSCTLDVTFAPRAPGLRLGAVNLFDSGGNALPTKLIYGIGQGPAVAFGPVTPTTVNTKTYTLTSPKGVAVDAAGDVFIEDTGDHTTGHNVVKIAADGTESVVVSGLSYPQGIAVDGAGNLFIADNDQNKVLEFSPGCTDSTCQKIVDSSFKSQLGVAVDGTGNVFFSDFGDGEVVEAPANGGAETVVYTAGSGFHPVGVAVDGAGDLFIAVFSDSPASTPGKVVEIPTGCTNSACQTTVGAGWFEPESVAVDAAGDIFVADEAPKVVEVPAGCIKNIACQIPASGILAYGVAVDGKGNVFLPDLDDTLADPNHTIDPYTNQVVVLNRSQAPSLNFFPTNVGDQSGDSPQSLTLQNVGNQPLTGSLALNLGGNFTQNSSTDCSGAFPLAQGAICSESFSFEPQSAGSLTGTAVFTDNALNAALATQTVALGGAGVGVLPTTVAVPNVIGLTQNVATTSIEAAGLMLGTVSTQSSSDVALGIVISQSPTSPPLVNLGSAVDLVVSSGAADQAGTPNPLTLLNNYFVTGDYVAAGVSLGAGSRGTGSISIPSSVSGGNLGVPDGADIIDAYLYWETVESTPTASGGSGTFDNFTITGQQIGTDQPNPDGSGNGTLRVYRADVNAYFAAQPNGIRLVSRTPHTVSLPDNGGTGFPFTEGASLVVIYRVLSPNFHLKAVVIYDGSAVPTGATTQLVQGFYDAVGGTTGENTNLFAAAGSWNTSTSSVQLPTHASQYSAALGSNSAYAAVILSTPVANSDDDGILDAWKTGPTGPSEFHTGQPGYYDVKTGLWVPLPGAAHLQKDLFVQLDYMCSTVNPDGTCATGTGLENLFPSPDPDGNDPLAMVQQAFASNGVQLHLQVGNAIQEDTLCMDNGSQLCQFPGQTGVVSWKNSLEFLKLWPRNLTACASGGDCTARFPYGQKDSYHYVLFGHSLAIPAWNTRYGTLTSIMVSGGTTTITTADRGSGINACPGRITISGVLSNPNLNGVYNTTTCNGTTTQIVIATPLSAVSPWSYSYATNTPPEPIISLTSGTITSISGYSDLGGSDSAVTLGLWLSDPTQDMSKRANVIAGTLFHEIGHTLGLSHGGLYYDSTSNYLPTFEANCKPNYQSSMNYLFQLDGVGPNRVVAFSNQVLTQLDEDTAGLVTQLTGPSNAPATFSTSAWYTPNAPSPTASAATRHCDGTPLTGPQGYRVDASIAPISPEWSSPQDINFDGQDNTEMRGYNDWGKIDLRQVGATGGEYASLASVLSFGSSTPQNIGPDESPTIGSGGTVTLGSGGTVSLSSGGTVTLGSGGTVTLGSGGNVTLSTGGTVTLGSGGTVTPGTFGTVALGSGGVVTINGSGTITDGGTTTVVPSGGGVYSIGSGGIVALGSGGTVTLGSGGIVTLGSGGTVTLGSGGTVALGSGGTVVLGSGGTVALGSGGTVTLGSGGTVTLGSGGTVTGSGGVSGSGGTVALGSGGTVTLGSGGTVTLGSGGTVALGSGGIVTLGSGGTVALGSGGTVTLGGGTFGSVTLGSGGTVTLDSEGTITSGGAPTEVGPGTYPVGTGGTVTLGSGGIVALGSGGTVTLGSGGIVALGSGGTVTLGSGGTVTLGSGGTVTLGSGGIVALGSGGTVALGSGGTVALGSGGIVALGSGGIVALGSGGTVTLGSGGAFTTELTYETANSIVRPPSNPTETPTQGGVIVNWKAPVFGVVQTYTISRSVLDASGNVVIAPSVIGTQTPPATTFTDTNPPTPPAGGSVVYTISTTLLSVPIDPTTRQSGPSVPAVLKMNQTITLGALPVSVLATGGPVTVTATAMSNGVANALEVTFSTTGPCSIGGQSSTPDANGVSSATVNLAGSTGTCTVIASQSGATTYNAATSVSGSFPILGPSGAQAITLSNVPASAAFNTSFTVTATGGASPNPVILTSSGVCTVSGSTYTMTSSTGICTVIANQAGTATFAPAPTVTQNVTATGPIVTVSPSNINFGTVILGSITTKTITVTNSGNAPVAINQPFISIVKGGNSNEFVSVNLCPSSLAAGKSCTITISFVAGPYYTQQTATLEIMDSAPGSPQPVTMTALVLIPQTITLTGVPPSAANKSSFTVTATGGASGNAVVLTSSGVCSITGTTPGTATYTMTSGTGTCSVIANQAGSATYAPAPQVTKTVTATLIAQTITLTGVPGSAAYKGSFTVTATGGASGIAVKFTSSGVCSITGTGTGTATYTMSSGTGSCSVIANQAGNSSYAAAPQVTKTVNATPLAQTIGFTTNPPGSAAYKSTFKVAATGGASGNAVTFTSSGSCSNSGATYTMTSGTGTCSVIANQAGNSNYAAAAQVTKTVTATLVPQTISFTTNPPASAANKSSFKVAATGGASGNPVTFTSSGSCSNSAGTYTMTSGTGTCSVIANQAGNSNYAVAAQVTKTVTAKQ